jgi:formylglycine-generating enzyme required for sulfatase activity
MSKLLRAFGALATLLVCSSLFATAGCPASDSGDGCTTATCSARCLAAGYGGGVCAGSLCQCSGRPDGGGDADGDGDADAPPEVEGGDEAGDAADDGPAGCPTETEEALLELCRGRAICLLGRFTITANPDEVDGGPSTDAFDGLEGVENLFVLTGDGVEYFTSPPERCCYDGWTAGSSAFDMTGASAAVCERLVPSLQGRTLTLYRVDPPTDDVVRVTSEQVGDWWSVTWSGELGTALNYRPFELTGTLTLERSEDDTITDRATGPCVLRSLYPPGTPDSPAGMVWVSIPAGTFDMGCSAGDTTCFSYESPLHPVTVGSFEMNETEVTQAQFQEIMGTNPSAAACGGDCPVESMTWREAGAFCAALGGRLPSEAEWEYAARAGTTTAYGCGADPACLDGVAWYNSTLDTPHAVRAKSPNAFGLYDTLGNVDEFVQDCWHDDYTGAPSTGEAWTTGDCINRAARGGSWHELAQWTRVSVRFRDRLDSRPYSIGFRCVR